MKKVRKFRILALLTALIVICLGFAAENLWNEISVVERSGRDVIFDNIKYGAISLPDISKKASLKVLSSDRRAAIVQAMGDYIKEYVHSTEFKDKYLQDAPVAPSHPVKPDPANYQNKGTDPSASDQVAQMEAMINSPGLTDDMKVQLRKALDELKKSGINTQEVDERNKKEKDAQLQSEYNDALKQYDADMILYDRDKKNYDSKMAEYKQMETSFNPDVIMKKRLSDFLQFTETIDFNAKLIDKGNKFFVFEKPEYENKSHDWKTCFRAGKVTIDAARIYAKSWLRQIDNIK